MTKKFQVEKKGKRSWVLIRQAAHDPQYRLGSHIPSYGKVVAVEDERTAEFWRIYEATAGER